MGGSTGELEDLLRAARLRVVGLIACFAAVAFLITLGIVVKSSSTVRDILKLTMWFTGCGLFAFLGTLWYRARMKAGDRLRRAAAEGSAIWGVEVSGFTFCYVLPLGWEVDMDVQDSDGDVVHVAFGFWSRDDADRLVHFLDDQIVAVPPPRPVARRVVARQVPRAVARDRRPPSQPL